MTTYKNNSILDCKSSTSQHFDNLLIARERVADGEVYKSNKRYFVSRHDTEESWLAERDKTGEDALITATCCGTIFGVSKYVSKLDLWQQKTGLIKKLTRKTAAMQRGIEYEPKIRDSFSAQYPEFEVQYLPYDIFHLVSDPYITCTLDGMLFAKRDTVFSGQDIKAGMKGVLEIKTGSYRNKAEYDSWDNLPMGYRAQVMHQMLVTGYDFAIVLCLLFKTPTDYNTHLPERKQARFIYMASDKEVCTDMDLVLREERDFYRSIITKEMPKVAL